MQTRTLGVRDDDDRLGAVNCRRLGVPIVVGMSSDERLWGIETGRQLCVIRRHCRLGNAAAARDVAVATRGAVGRHVIHRGQTGEKHRAAIRKE